MRSKRLYSLSQESRISDIAGMLAGGVAGYLASPLLSAVSHHRLWPSMILEAILFLGVYFFVRMKIFDLMDKV